MSANPTPGLAAKAAAAAVVAEAVALGMSPGRLIGQRFRASLAARPVPVADSLPARTWREIDARVRVAVVMLATDTPGDIQALARQPWDAWSNADKARIASTARQLSGELRSAACLW